MDKTLINYEKNLEELERQKEKLQKVMQMMGQEWEESGPGIGWLGQATKLNDIKVKESTSVMTVFDEPLFTNMLSSPTSPSPEYLQSLLTVNEALMVESLSPVIDQTSLPRNNMIEDGLNTPLMTSKENATHSKDFYSMIHQTYK